MLAHNNQNKNNGNDQIANSAQREKFNFYSLRDFFLAVTKLLWEKYWALDYNSMRFRDFPEIF